jgi:hypothetical protein
MTWCWRQQQQRLADLPVLLLLLCLPDASKMRGARKGDEPGCCCWCASGPAAVVSSLSDRPHVCRTGTRCDGTTCARKTQGNDAGKPRGCIHLLYHPSTTRARPRNRPRPAAAVLNGHEVDACTHARMHARTHARPRRHQQTGVIIAHHFVLLLTGPGSSSPH